jgi:FlaA1/EpsC-like NDP-sugar epimerase
MLFVESVTKWLQSRNTNFKISVVALSDFALFILAVLLAYALRLSALELPTYNRLPLYLAAPVLSVASGFIMQIYWSVSRSYSAALERRVLLSQILAAIAWILLLFVLGTTGFARSVVVIYTLLAVAGMIGLRRVAVYMFSHESRLKQVRALIPCLIYGAGLEGQQLAEAMRRQQKYRPLAFLDTDYTLVGRVVSGLKVYTFENLDYVITRYHPKEVIIAKPSIARAGLRDLFHIISDKGLAAKIVPNLRDLIDGSQKLGELRDIRVEDLLGRDPVPPDDALLDKATKGLVVMVSGAGGSIGSELVRQVALRKPRKIVLVDHNEFSLFEVHREIESLLSANKTADFEIVAVLADVKDKQFMSGVITNHSVEVVFHAAAYKHVRMVQENALAGIRNNVFGTKALAEASMEVGVKRFILISTDKAVRPTSIMGASKRVAEMVVQALASKPGHGTIFSMVRFGNVLGSTGSVVPLFREQIASGGPVRVTHEDVTRYFMLIPEAAQLVVQAGAMAEGGEVFVLDMGEPIKIMKLAQTMIDLAGLSQRSVDNPDGDIEIQTIGLREGEKLYEELQIGSDVSSTQHQRIMRSREFFLPLQDIENNIVDFLQGDLEKALLRLFALASQEKPD